MATTTVLPQLEAGEGAASYNPNTFDYQSESERQAAGLSAFPSSDDWLRIFHDSIESFGKTASKDTNVEDADKKAAAFADIYRKKLDGLSSAINCLKLCTLRYDANTNTLC
jgi:hypothetical protein